MQSVLKDSRSFPLACSLLAACLSALFTGCPDGTPSPDAKQTTPFAGQRIVVSTPEAFALQTPLEPVLEEWAARTGGSVAQQSWQAAGPGDFLQQLPENSDQQHVALVPVTWLPELESAGRLRPLPDSQLAPGNLDWLDVLEGVRGHVLSVEDQAVGVPVACPTLICYYRSDLLSAARREPPETWQDYLELVETRRDWAGDLDIVEPWHESFRATMFLARAVCFAQDPENFSLFFDISTGTPLIDQPGFIRGMEISRRILAELPEQVAEMTPGDCRDAVLSGRAAMALAFEPGVPGRRVPYLPSRDRADAAGPSADVERGPRPERTRNQRALPEGATVDFCLLPGATEVFNITAGSWREQDASLPNRVTLTGFGGACLVLIAAADSPEPEEPLAACNLLRELSLQQMPQAFRSIMPTLCRKSQFSAASAWLGSELTSGERQAYLRVTLLGLSSRVVVELPVVERARFRATLTRAVSRGLFGDGASEAVLGALREEWQDLCNRLGPDVVRDSYRRQLGLSPFD